VQQAIVGLRFVKRIAYYRSLPSTNLLARALTAEASSSGTVVIADDQTQGRGRLGHTWSVPPCSGLTFSLCLALDQLLPLHTLTPVATLAVHDVVHSLVGARCSVKWPNDVLVDGLKVAGILIGLVDAGDTMWAIIGIGLNVGAAPDLPGASSLAAATTRTLARESLLADLLRALDARLVAACQSPSAVMDEWRSSLSTIGRRVRARTPRETVEGMVLDVDGEGSLVIRLDDGQVRSLPAAELAQSPGDPT
jgi:BirA family biotin operon repressor/biotin-[acetyl-CoA-carboxylase] ligase